VAPFCRVDVPIEHAEKAVCRVFTSLVGKARLCLFCQVIGKAVLSLPAESFLAATWTDFSADNTLGSARVPFQAELLSSSTRSHWISWIGYLAFTSPNYRPLFWHRHLALYKNLLFRSRPS